MTRLLASRGRHAGVLVAEEDVFARRRGRHCRRGGVGSLTGWAGLSQLRASAEDFTARRRPVALAPFPLSADIVPFRSEPYPRPYSPKDAA